MRKLMLFSLIIFSSALSAQVDWFPHGTEFKYYKGSPSLVDDENNGIERYYCDRDTVIDGTTYRYIESDLTFLNSETNELEVKVLDPLFQREEDGVVYQYRPYLSELALYDFNVSIGDTILYESMLVTDKYSFDADESSLTMFVTRDICDGELCQISRFFIEGLGIEKYGFRWIENYGCCWHGNAESTTYSLYCVNHPQLGTLEFGSIGCDGLPGALISSTHEVVMNEIFQTNVFSDIVFWTDNNQNISISLLDMSGVTLFENMTESINVQTLANGIYLAQISENGKYIGTQKLLIVK